MVSAPVAEISIDIRERLLGTSGDFSIGEAGELMSIRRGDSNIMVSISPSSVSRASILWMKVGELQYSGSSGAN